MMTLKALKKLLMGYLMGSAAILGTEIRDGFLTIALSPLKISKIKRFLEPYLRRCLARYRLCECGGIKQNDRG